MKSDRSALNRLKCLLGHKNNHLLKSFEINKLNQIKKLWATELNVKFDGVYILQNPLWFIQYAWELITLNKKQLNKPSIIIHSRSQMSALSNLKTDREYHDQLFCSITILKLCFHRRKRLTIFVEISNFWRLIYCSIHLTTVKQWQIVSK
jgi:hypothetical protein